MPPPPVQQPTYEETEKHYIYTLPHQLSKKTYKVSKNEFKVFRMEIFSKWNVIKSQLDPNSPEYALDHFPVGTKIYPSKETNAQGRYDVDIVFRNENRRNSIKYFISAPLKHDFLIQEYKGKIIDGLLEKRTHKENYMSHKRFKYHLMDGKKYDLKKNNDVCYSYRLTTSSTKEILIEAITNEGKKICKSFPCSFSKSELDYQVSTKIDHWLFSSNVLPKTISSRVKWFFPDPELFPNILPLLWKTEFFRRKKGESASVPDIGLNLYVH